MRSPTMSSPSVHFDRSWLYNLGVRNMREVEGKHFDSWCSQIGKVLSHHSLQPAFRLFGPYSCGNCLNQHRCFSDSPNMYSVDTFCQKRHETTSAYITFNKLSEYVCETAMSLLRSNASSRTSPHLPYMFYLLAYWLSGTTSKLVT